LRKNIKRLNKCRKKPNNAPNSVERFKVPTVSMGFVPTGHRPIKSRHFYQAGDNVFDSLRMHHQLRFFPDDL
jgi:hypothetical protein